MPNLQSSRPLASLLGVLLLSVPVRGAADAPQEAAEAAPLPATTGEWAIRMIGYLRSDADNLCDSAAKVIAAFTEEGKLEEARNIAKELPGYRRAVELYRLASRHAVLGQQDDAAECRKLAETGDGGTKDFEREAVAGARIEALAAAGDLKQARAELGNIVSLTLRNEVEAGLFAYEGGAEAGDRVAEFAEKDPVSPSLRGKALLLVAEGHLRAKRRDEAKVHAEKGIHMLCKLADPETIPLMHRAVALLVELDERKEAARWARVCLGFAERTDERAPWKSRDLRLAAESLEAAGEKAEAEAVFRRIPEMPGKLDVFAYFSGAMEAASAYLHTGKKQLFEQASEHVLRMCLKHPHYRARAMAAMEVLAAHARGGVEISDTVRAALGAVAESIEADSHYQKPV